MWFCTVNKIITMKIRTPQTQPRLTTRWCTPQLFEATKISLKIKGCLIHWIHYAVAYVSWIPEIKIIIVILMMLHPWVRQKGKERTREGFFTMKAEKERMKCAVKHQIQYVDLPWNDQLPCLEYCMYWKECILNPYSCPMINAVWKA